MATVFLAGFSPAGLVHLPKLDQPTQIPPEENNEAAQTPQEENSEPVAVALISGSESIFTSGDTVVLDGGGSYDADKGDRLTYKWSQTNGPTTNIKNPNSINPQFAAPVVDSQSLVTFQLIVSDSKEDSEPSSVDLTVCPSGSFTDVITGECVEEQAEPDKPVAKAVMIEPKKTSVNPKDIVSLDGSLSSDSLGGEALTYSWKQVGKPSSDLYVELTEPKSPRTDFTAPEVKTETDIKFDLVVTDDFSQLGQPYLESEPDTVTVRICPDKGFKDVKTGIFYHIKATGIDPKTNSCDYSKIDIRVRPIETAEKLPFAWHLYIVYTDAIGEEYYYRGGPNISQKRRIL